MQEKGIFCLVFVLFAGASSVLAGNPNEATGFPPLAVMIDGPGGDSISAYNGSLEFGIPIGSHLGAARNVLGAQPPIFLPSSGATP